VDWKKEEERICFNEWSNPDDDELGLQIVRVIKILNNIYIMAINRKLMKDLHRTGCSLFCGDGAEENQLMLKRVLLAYARWNKQVGYCKVSSPSLLMA